jgi:hypothetical protein
VKKFLLAVSILVVAAAVATGLRYRGEGSRRDRRHFENVTLLDASLEPLRVHFNANRDRVRLLTILSPSCPVCLEGILATKREILEAGLEVEVSLVWMEVLPFDVTRNPGRRIALLEGHPQVVQFYDAGQHAGRMVAARLDWPDQTVAWDVYLFFAPGETWQSGLPEPSSWFHQRSEVENEHYRTGDSLRAALRQAATAPQ